jgi:hypothetical protein
MNSLTAERADGQPSFPRTWDWDTDGPTAAGTFVRFDSGPTKGYGRKPIVVLRIEGEERSVWILETALFGRFRDEIAQRPGRKLTAGERIVIRRGDMKRTQDGSREYRATTAYFPDAPEPSAAELFGLDEKPATTAGENGQPDEEGSLGALDQDVDIPF